MTKRQIIDEIMGMNRSAQPEFLARFSDDDLSDYLEHLKLLRTPRLSGDPRRYDMYFENCPPVRCESPDRSAESDGKAAEKRRPKRRRRGRAAVSAGADDAQSDEKGARKPFASQQGSQSWLF